MARKREEWALLGVPPGSVIRVMGMRGSGNAQVLSWLQAAAPNGAVFFNNCKPRKHPAESCSYIEVDGQRGVREVNAGVTVLYSYEDRVPDMSRFDLFREGVEQVDRELLIYRGALDWLAAYLTKIRANQGYDQAKRQEVMARMGEKYIQFLEIVQGHAPRLVPLQYERWAASEAYRADVVAALGWPSCDVALEVPDAEGWEALREDAEFRACVAALMAAPRARVALRAVFREDFDEMREMTE